MTPTLTELIAACQQRGIQGSYRAWHDPPYWRARVSVGAVSFSAPADTRDEALERAAGIALSRLIDPPPRQPGSKEYAEWQERRAAAQRLHSEGLIGAPIVPRSVG